MGTFCLQIIFSLFKNLFYGKLSKKWSFQCKAKICFTFNFISINRLSKIDNKPHTCFNRSFCFNFAQCNPRQSRIPRPGRDDFAVTALEVNKFQQSRGRQSPRPFTDNFVTHSQTRWVNEGRYQLWRAPSRKTCASRTMRHLHKSRLRNRGQLCARAAEQAHKESFSKSRRINPSKCR